MISKTSILFLCSLLCIIISGCTHRLFTMQSNGFTKDIHKSQLSIMTFNVRRMGKEQHENRLWKNRKQLVIDVIRDHLPDIMGLQEPIKQQLDDIAQALPEYDWIGSGRGDAWFGAVKSEFTPIFYKKDRFIVHNYGTFFINQQAIMPWNWSTCGLLPRIATWALFEDQITKQQFYVYNTHLEHFYEDARTNGMHKLLGHIKDNVRNDLPIILMGDFNRTILYHSDQKFYSTLEKMLVANNFVHTKSLARECLASRTTQSNWGIRQKLNNIDHILLRNAEDTFHVDSYHVIPEKVEGQYPSDHRPVIIKCYLPPAKTTSNHE